MSSLTAWERWELASFDEGRGAASPEAAGGDALQTQLPTAAEIAQIQEQARAEGFKKGESEGYQAGLRRGHDETRGEAERLARAAAKLESGLDALDAEVAEELLALAIELAREVVRQEIAARPDTLLAVVREALTQLPHQHAAIYLHPEDASLLRSYMGDQLAHAGHRIHEDFKLARGDCLLESGGTQVDATVAMRWQRVLAGLGI
ncbi:MAG: flagellar assembly protein FliH [Rhodocyclaceae bacterium]|nr:flagellar assembly protein FliH [Rhodocyclaceae bacterium]